LPAIASFGNAHSSARIDVAAVVAHVRRRLLRIKIDRRRMTEGQARIGGYLDAETKKDALVAFDAFVEIYAIKYEKAVECLIRTEMLRSPEG
jgi:hypothetical protein